VGTSFYYSGGYMQYTVPAGVTSVTVHVWGGGGGGGYGTAAVGGAGAYVNGSLSVSPGQVVRVVVGRGGPWLGVHGSDAQGGGGGGWPGALSTGTYYGGAGGGRSAVQRWAGASVGWEAVATAGGGGGGGGYNAAGGAAGVERGRRGGDGLRTAAFTPNPAAPGSVWGGGANRTAPGRGSYAGATGRAFNGGDATNGTRNQCGGGGGGYFGGGAGNDGPGGGGSSYTGGLTRAGGSDSPGAGAPAAGSRYYSPGVAVGGSPLSPGGHGLVVLVPGPVGSRAPSPSRSRAPSPSRSRAPSTTASRTPSAAASRSRTKKPK
jgi:hypothetical protein